MLSSDSVQTGGYDHGAYFELSSLVDMADTYSTCPFHRE